MSTQNWKEPTESIISSGKVVMTTFPMIFLGISRTPIGLKFGLSLPEESNKMRQVHLLLEGCIFQYTTVSYILRLLSKNPIYLYQSFVISIYIWNHCQWVLTVYFLLLSWVHFLSIAWNFIGCTSSATSSSKILPRGFLWSFYQW